MVTFLTLLLGLVLGERKIELAVDDRVASVEVWLDGRVVETVQGPPWSFSCDFGARLAPHLLEVVARDGQGREIDRALQKVNLPREPVEVTLALHSGEHGYRAVEVVWNSVGGLKPLETHVYFDGEPLDAQEGPQVELPSHDLAATHVISAELVFPQQLRATAGLAFGGEYGEDVSSELTAVPLDPSRAKARAGLPSAKEVETWLRVGGSQPRVVAVERGPFELIVVRDESSLDALRSMGSRVLAGQGGARKGTLHFLNSRPVYALGVDGSSSALFPLSVDANANGSGLQWAMTHLFFTPGQEGRREEVSGAVAVAAVRAAGSRRPRGLLLVAGPARSVDPERGLDPSSVREFVAALRVPFFYWRVDEAADATPDGWGTPTPIRDLGDLRRAESELTSALRPQFLAWLDGSHMPDQVTTTPAASSMVRLAGAIHR